MQTDPEAALDLLAGLTDHIGGWWEMATPLQREDARALLDMNGPRRHWLGRAKGYSKTRDVAACSIVALLTQFPRFSDQHGYVAAANAEQATLVRQSIQAFADGTPGLQQELRIETRKVTAVNRGTELHILPADTAGAHGIRPCWLILDELANWPNTAGHEDFFGSAWAGLVKTSGRGIIMTTAGTPSHFSYQVFVGAGKDPMWRLSDVKGPAPWSSPAEIESERLTQSESRFARLFNNEWTTADDALVTADDLAAAAVLVGHVSPQPGVRYVMTLDVGLVNDRTVLVVAHREGSGESERVIVDRIWRWQGTHRQPVDLREVEETIVEAHNRYPGEVLADPFQAIGLLQNLTKREIPATKFDFTSTSVGRLAGSLLRALRSRSVSLPNDPVLLEELAGVRIVENSAGVPRLDHDAGQHDDQAVAIALAVHRLTDGVQPRPEILFADDGVGNDLAGQPLQLLNGAFAMQATDTFESHLGTVGSDW